MYAGAQLRCGALYAFVGGRSAQEVAGRRHRHQLSATSVFPQASAAKVRESAVHGGSGRHGIPRSAHRPARCPGEGRGRGLCPSGFTSCQRGGVDCFTDSRSLGCRCLCVKACEHGSGDLCCAAIFASSALREGGCCGRGQGKNRVGQRVTRTGAFGAPCARRWRRPFDDAQMHPGASFEQSVARHVSLRIPLDEVLQGECDEAKWLNTLLALELPTIAQERHQTDDFRIRLVSGCELGTRGRRATWSADYRLEIHRGGRRGLPGPTSLSPSCWERLSRPSLPRQAACLVG